MSRPYNKPSLNIQQQLAHLQKNGMTITDERAASYWLSNVSYYRLSAYWLYFEIAKGSAGPRFTQGTSFERVSTWSNDLKDHLSSHPENDLDQMGFPADWQASPIWSSLLKTD